MRRTALVDWHVAAAFSGFVIVAASLVAVSRLVMTHHLIADATLVDGGIAVALMAAVSMLFRVLMATKDREHQALTDQLNGLIREKERDRLEVESMKKSYADIAAEAAKAQTDTVNFYRNREGKPPLVVLPPVIAESHSPSTAIQREAAYIQTLRAQVAAAKLAEGLEPRVEPPHAIEPLKPGEMAPAPLASGEKVEIKGAIKTTGDAP